MLPMENNQEAQERNGGSQSTHLGVSPPDYDAEETVVAGDDTKL